jgi:hypothetical protein
MTAIDNTILNVLEKQSFFSIRELIKITYISTITVYGYRKQSLGFVMKHLHGIPHSFLAIQKAQHVIL